MSFIKSINNAFVKCFDFKTRATRSEFWYFYLFTTVIGFMGLQFDQLFELQNAVDSGLIINRVELGSEFNHDNPFSEIKRSIC